MAVTWTTSPGYTDYLSKNSGEIDTDIDSFLDYDDQDVSAFLLKKSGSEKKETAKYTEWEAEYQARTITINEAVTTSEAAIDISAAGTVRNGDLIHVIETADTAGQYLHVTSGAGTTTLTCSRITTGPITTGSTGFIYHNATSEVATASATASYVYASSVTNAMTIIRRAIEWSMTEDETRLYTGDSRMNKEKQARVDLRKDIVHALWFSYSDTTPSVTGTFLARGIIPTLQANAAALRVNCNSDVMQYSDVTNLGGALLEFSDTDEYVVFSGTNALTSLAKLGTNSGVYQSRPGDSAFGFGGTTVAMGNKKFVFTFERCFKEFGAPFNNMAVFLNLKHVRRTHLGSGGFKFFPDVTLDPGGETRKAQFRYQGGISMRHAKRHGYLFNIAA